MRGLHILVGGSGFVANHLRESLAKAGKNVLIVDKKKPQHVRKTESFFRWDIRESLPEDLADCIQSDTVVHHLAAVHFDFQRDFFETNVTGTVNVIDCFAECRKWIFYSSVATYGDSGEERSESSKQKPSNDYGKSKLAMEEEILQLHEKGTLQGNIIIVRPGVVYGEWNFGNVFNLMWLSARFAPIGLRTNPIKSMAYVKNLVASTLFALDQSVENEPLVYNYVDYDQLGTMDLLKAIAIAKGVRPIFIPFELVYVAATIFNLPFAIIGRDFLVSPMRVKKFAQPTHFLSDKIRQLGFVQPVSPQNGIERTIRWIDDNDIKTLRDEWKKSFTV